MLESFDTLLLIQDLDIKLIRLVRVRSERRGELEKICSLRNDITEQVEKKQQEVTEIKKEIRLGEVTMKEIQEKVVHLEAQQSAVKKMDEFNALTQQLTQLGRERNTNEHTLSDLTDRLSSEEDLLTTLKENLESTEANSIALEKEINESIGKINEEGRELLVGREKMIEQVPEEMFAIYERLLKNKKDRVLVPIENRTCSGCHIVLTPQHENIVRKQDRLVFCEHCSRILYWQEEQPEQSEEKAPKRRRRRVVAST